MGQYKVKTSGRVVANLFLLVVSIGASLCLGEVSLRVLGYTLPYHPPYYQVPPNYYRSDSNAGYDIAEKFFGGVFAFPQYLRTYGVEFPISSNSLGCRDRAFVREDGYILLLGDSVTWGYVGLEETWGTFLEEAAGMRVLKCGVSGYGPRHELFKLESVVSKAGPPKLVIVGYTVANDLLDDYLYPGRTVIDGYLVTKVGLVDDRNGERKTYSEAELKARLREVLRQPSQEWVDRGKSLLVEHSVLYNQLRMTRGLKALAAKLGLAEAPTATEVAQVFRPQTFSPRIERAWQEHLGNLLKLRMAVERTGAKLLVVLLPTPDQVYEFMRPEAVEAQWGYPNERLSGFFAEEGIAYLDLLPEFKRRARRTGKPILDPIDDLYWPDDGHLNVKGNQLTGLLISKYVVDHELLPGTGIQHRLMSGEPSLDAQKSSLQ